MNLSSKPRFDALAALARQEPVPPVDVTQRVLERLTKRVPEPSTDWLLAAAAVVSVAAAILVVTFASQQGVLSTDSLAELIRPFTPIIQ